MIVFKESVDDEKFMEIILTEHEAAYLEKHGSIYSKQKIEDEIVNLGIRIDDFDKTYLR